MIDSVTVSRILDAAQIYDVVSDFVSLRKRGANFVGLCPFHDDTTPSFYVSPAKGFCKCFACGKGGNAVGFIMEHEQLDYPGALRYLAKKYGIEIQERELSDDEKRAQNERESLFIVNQYANDYFHDTLLNNPEGRSVGLAYFRSRGFRDDIIEKFHLGFSLEQWDAFAKTALAKGYQRDFLIKTGLCFENGDKSLTDRFRGRAMFPIYTLSGKVVGFSGRVLSKQTKGVAQKYVNSPDSEVYHKSNELFGIYQARTAISRHDVCYIVEGQTDVISMFQCGIEHVVAPLGTALTEQQIKVIHRLTDNVVLLNDGDEAGIHATLKDVELLLKEDMNVKICLLPDKEDPDSFARKHNSEEFKAYIDTHSTDLIRFQINLFEQGVDKGPGKRAELVQTIVNSIACIKSDITRDVYIRDAAQLLKTEDRLIVQEVAKARNRLKEEKKTEQAREQARQERLNAQEAPAEVAPAPEPEVVSPQVQALDAPNPFYVYERQIIQMVVRYGERRFGEAVPREDGLAAPLSVIEFVQSELEIDGLCFRTPLFSKIMTEGMAHMLDDDFVAERYFINHPDSDISALSIDLCSERYQLSKYHSKNQKIQKDEERLEELVPKLTLNYKYAIVKDMERQKLRELTDPAVMNDVERCNDIMNQIKDLRDLLARMSHLLGDRVVVLH